MMRTTNDGRGTTDGRLNCEQFAERLADFMEREVDERIRASMESHALGCADCGPLLADLRKLRIDAANLPALSPSRDLWSGIAERIEAPVIQLPTADDGRRTTDDSRRVIGGRRIWMGLAAAGLVAITAGVTYVTTKQMLTRNSAPTQVAQTQPTSSDSVLPPTPDTAQPDTTSTAPMLGGTPVVAARNPSTDVRRSPTADSRSPIEIEIARLKGVVNQRRSQLDPVTIGIVDRNLMVIDDAIAQVKQALQKDPESRFLMESLNDALANKVEILRTAATLPSRT
jgi:hypothetical protein